jgi:hypothetical protein
MEEGNEMKAKVSKVFGAHAGLMSFVLGFTLLASPVFVNVPDPVSNGTGIIQGAQDLDVTIVEVELVRYKLVSLECGWDFARYTYDVKLSLVNETASVQYGMVMVSFYDPGQAKEIITTVDDLEVNVAYQGSPVASFPVFVEVDAGTTQTIEETIVLDGIALDAGEFRLDGTTEAHTVTATTKGEFVSPFGGGTGRVSILEWLRLI